MHKSRFKKRIAGLSKAIGFQELNISLGHANAERMAEFILAMRSAEKGIRKSLITKKLEESF